MEDEEECWLAASGGYGRRRHSVDGSGDCEFDFTRHRGRRIVSGMEERETPPEAKSRYRWPWLVLALLVLGVVLAILWMSVAVKRVQAERQATPLPAPAEPPR